jgi:Flp pilus assembly protein TadG
MRHRRRHNRRGTVLVLFVLLIFGIMAIAGLAIDLGFVMQTRRTMQAAVNTAALEGLRNGPPAASDMAHEVFRDPNNQIVFGAGPNVVLEGGIPLGDGGYLASQTIIQQSSQVWQPPALNTNASAEQDGDIVPGQYVPDAINHNEGVEGVPYQRYDFNPAVAADQQDAMLVRMRRTTEAQNGTLSPGATGGPPVPLLFSRGDPLLLYGGSTLLATGVPVRATAIARWSLVSSVRSPVYYANPASPTQLLLPIALTVPFWTVGDQPAATTIWNAFGDATNPLSDIGQLASVTVGPSTVTYMDPVSKTPQQAIYLMFTPPVAPAAFLVGEQFTPQPWVPSDQTGVAPIAQFNSSSGYWVVVGFAYITFSSKSGTITRYRNKLLPPAPLPESVTHATQNASASFSAFTADDLSRLTLPPDFTAAMTARDALAIDPSTNAPPSSAAYLLYAPALVRSMGFSK